MVFSLLHTQPSLGGVMDVLIMGTGGVGGYFGALLGRAGHRLTVIARGAHLEALQRDGLHVESVPDDDFTVPVHS